MTLRARARTPLVPPEGARTHLGAGYMRVCGRADRLMGNNGETVGAPNSAYPAKAKRKGQQMESESMKDGKKGGQHGLVGVAGICDGECERCPNALPEGARTQVEGEVTVCRFGWKYLRTDAPPGNLFGVREADALGEAAALARAKRARPPPPKPAQCEPLVHGRPPSAFWPAGGRATRTQARKKGGRKWIGERKTQGTCSCST